VIKCIFKELVLFVVCAIVYTMIYTLFLILVLNASPKLQTSHLTEPSQTPLLQESAPSQTSSYLQETTGLIDLFQTPVITLKELNPLIQESSKRGKNENCIFAYKDKIKHLIRLPDKADTVMLMIDSDQLKDYNLFSVDSLGKEHFDFEKFVKLYLNNDKVKYSVNIYPIILDDESDKTDRKITDLSDKIPKSFEEIIQKAQISKRMRKKSVQKILSNESKKQFISRKISQIEYKDFICLFVSKGEVENLISLSEDATHVVFEIHYDQVKGNHLFLVNNLGKEKLDIINFFKLYLNNDEFRNSINTQIMKLVANDIDSSTLSTIAEEHSDINLDELD